MKEVVHYAGLSSNLLDELDMDRAKNKESGEGKKLPKEAKKKVRKNLDTEEATGLNVMTAGIMEANGINMCNILNEAITIKSVNEDIAELHDLMGLIIEQVVESRDRGTVKVFWSCGEVDKFLDFVKIHEGKTGRYKKISREMKENIAKRLANAEPRLRAFLVRKMDFRRVPRLDFQEASQELKNWEGDPRQAHVRAIMAKRRAETESEEDIVN